MLCTNKVVLTQDKINESHDMGNAWVFPSISHSMGKCNKTHHEGETWEIGTHTFPIVWVIFSYSVPILWYTYFMGNAWFSHQFPIEQKNPTKPIVWKGPGKLVLVLFTQYGHFFLLDSLPMVLYITWQMCGFSNQFPIAWENSAKTIKWAKPGKLVPILFP